MLYYFSLNSRVLFVHIRNKCHLFAMNSLKYSNDFPNLSLYSLWRWKSKLSRKFDSYVTKYQDKFSLCKAGFKFPGDRDYVQCFNCAVVLRDWLSTDNPRVEHVFFFYPDVHLYYWIKSIQFIDAALNDFKKIIVHNCECNGRDVVCWL